MEEEVKTEEELDHLVQLACNGEVDVDEDILEAAARIHNKISGKEQREKLAVKRRRLEEITSAFVGGLMNILEEK